MNFEETALQWIDRPVWGNSLGTWALAGILIVVFQLVLSIFARWLRSRSQKIEISQLFLLGFSIYCSTVVLQLKPQVNLFLSRLLILAGIFQAGITGKSLIQFAIKKAFLKDGADPSIQNTLGLMNTLARGVLYATLVLIALNNFGVDIVGKLSIECGRKGRRSTHTIL
jgi:hypothetical protein